MPTGGASKAGADAALQIALAQIALQSAQQLRELTAAEFETYLIATDSALVRAARGAGQAYSAAVQNNKNHKLAPPFVHTFMVVVETLAADERVGKKHREVLKTYVEWAAGQKVERVADQVRLHRVARTYKGERTKIQFKLMQGYGGDDSDEQMTMEEPDVQRVAKAYSKGLLSAGAEHKVGRAPPGELERVIAKALDEARARAAD